MVAAAQASTEERLPAEGRVGAFGAARAQMPEEYADVEPPFLAAVAVPADAPAIDRLVAWQGRSPAWPT